MLGYATTLYLNKELGDKIFEALEKLKNQGEQIKMTGFLRNGAAVYIKALEIFFENRDKFSNVDDFNEWISGVLDDLKKKVNQITKEEFKKLREGKQPDTFLMGEKNVGEDRFIKEFEDIVRRIRGISK